MRVKLPAFPFASPCFENSLLPNNISSFFSFRGDRQMMEIFVSGTQVFSHTKMTESPYERRRVDMYALGSTVWHDIIWKAKYDA